MPRVVTPAGGDDSRGSRANGAPPRGSTARTRRGSSGRAIGCSIAASRIIDGCGRSQWNPSQWARRVRRVRVGSTCSRAASIIRPNGTCEGHTSSQARQTRQRSMKSANVASTSAPAATARIAAIRPRGDADSSPVSRYVGQCGRHSPQATHADRSSVVGASRPGSQPGVPSPVAPTKRVPSGRSVPSGVEDVGSMAAMLRPLTRGCGSTVIQPARGSVATTAERHARPIAESADPALGRRAERRTSVARHRARSSCWCSAGSPRRLP